MEEYRRWEDNTKMDLKEISVDVMNWIVLYQMQKPRKITTLYFRVLI